MRVAAALIGVILCMAAASSARAATWESSAIASHAMLYLDAPPGFRDAMFREAAASGATSIRVDVPIPAIVKDQSGTRSWTELDDIARLARKYRIQVVGLIYGTPWWLAKCPARTEDLDYYECPPRRVAPFAAFAKEIARHTRGTIDTWQVLNEPNNRYVFAGNVHDYARVLIATSRAIRSVNPRARIVLGGLGGPQMQIWPARLLAIRGTREAFDVASVHLRGRLKVVTSAVAFWKRRLGELGFHGPIWATEHGYPTDPKFQWDPRFQGVQGQARYLSRSLPALIGAGIDRIFVTLRDNRGGPWATEGLIGGTVFDPPSPDPQVVRKPAALAVRRFALSLLLRAPSGASLTSPSIAQAPLGSLRAARSCYAPGRVMRLRGSGYVPGQQIQLAFVASGTRAAQRFTAQEPVTVRPDGTFAAVYRAPPLPSSADRRATLTVSAGAATGEGTARPFAAAAAAGRLAVSLRSNGRDCRS
jgi:hypothetical protein